MQALPKEQAKVSIHTQAFPSPCGCVCISFSMVQKSPGHILHMMQALLGIGSDTHGEYFGSGNVCPSKTRCAFDMPQSICDTVVGHIQERFELGCAESEKTVSGRCKGQNCEFWGVAKNYGSCTSCVNVVDHFRQRLDFTVRSVVILEHILSAICTRLDSNLSQ